MADGLHEAINRAKERLNINFALYPEQQKVISLIVDEKKDLIAVLPTGFGKSLIFQLLPFVLDELDSDGTNCCILVVSPLNAIMEDQICKLSQEYHAVIVKRQKAVTSLDLRDAKLIFGHAESFVDDKGFRSVLREETMQRRVKAIVIDEAHFVVQWKHFRPAYGKLSALGSIFPEIPMLALTATANQVYKKEIEESMAMRNPVIIDKNPDRPNLFLRVSRRPNVGDEKISTPLEGLVKELKVKREKMLRTIVYGSLEVCGECYSFFEIEMGHQQYYIHLMLPIFSAIGFLHSTMPTILLNIKMLLLNLR